MKRKDVLSTEQLAFILGISEKTVKKLVKDKEIPAEYVNRRLRFRMSQIIRHFEKIEGGAA